MGPCVYCQGFSAPRSHEKRRAAQWHPLGRFWACLSLLVLHFPSCCWAVQVLPGHCGQIHHVCSISSPYTPLWKLQSFHLCLSGPVLSLVLNCSHSWLTNCCLLALTCPLSQAWWSCWCSPPGPQGLPGSCAGSSLPQHSWHWDWGIHTWSHHTFLFQPSFPAFCTSTETICIENCPSE